MRVTVPSSTFQSTSASISRKSPADFSAFIQLRISPKAMGFRCTVIVSHSPCGTRLVLGKALGGRRDLGDEIAHQLFVLIAA